MSSTLPRHGGQLWTICERFDLDASTLLDFSANINPDGPPAPVTEALHAALGAPAVLTQYPDMNERELRATIAQYAGVQPENVIVANGFVPLLDAVLQALAISHCLVPVPSFNEYRRALERHDVKVTATTLRPGDAFQYQWADLQAAEHDAVLLANPQNPSGVLTDREALLRYVRAAEGRGAWVLLDEAFIDYAPEHSLTNLVEQFSNLVVFRSVTKCFGIPGLRVAYAVMQDELRLKVERHLSPWAITNLAAVGVMAALRDAQFARAFRGVNERRRGELEQGLRALGLTVYPAAANFLLLRLPRGLAATTVWETMLREHSILLRLCDNFEALSDGHLRIAVLGAQQNKCLLRAMRSVLSI